MSSNQPSSDGWCPFATRVPTSKYWSGNQFLAVCLHIAEGSYEAAVSWLSNADSNPNSSAHFVVAKDGRIAQLVSIYDSAWCNGLGWSNGQWVNPRGVPVTPSWQDIIPGVNPNRNTISIEHEGYYQEQWTPAMYAANTRLLAWIAAQVGPLPWQPKGLPLQYVPHRTLIGHYEIDPVDRPNCPGPNVNYGQISNDANGTTLLSLVTPQPHTAHIYGTTALLALPSRAIVTQLNDMDAAVYGYLDYQGKRWFITPYSFDNQRPNFFEAASTVPSPTLVASLSLNPGNHAAVMPGADELGQLGAKWIRLLLLQRFQDFNTGQNSDLDWALSAYRSLGVNTLVLINPETFNQVPPPHGSGWGDANSGYIGSVSDLAQKVASFYNGRIGAIEIFNEPDIQGILPEDYAALLRACYAKIKSVSSLPVISAGICCGENYDYLRRVTSAAMNAYDYAAWHVYAERVDNFPSADWGFGDLRNSLITARAIAGQPLWVTEIGARLDYNWPGGLDPENSVSTYLTRAFTLMNRLGQNCVAQAFWFTWKIAGETWGMVDDAGTRRPAWFAFQQQTHPVPPGAVGITNVTFSPLTLTAGNLLNVSITVMNNSNETLATQDPAPDFIYAEGENFLSRGFPNKAGALRVGVDFDGRQGVDHPYRWGLGGPLAPGQTTTVIGAIKLNNPQSKHYWAGVVREEIAWLEDQQGPQTIIVQPPGPPPNGAPVISAVSLTPTTLDQGGVMNVSITVRNDGGSTLQTQDPPPGFSYKEGETFLSKGYAELSDDIRVGIDFEGRQGIDHPYRWGLGAPLAPGQTTTVTGAIQLNNSQSKNYWAGLVREKVVWLQDHQGTQKITVNGQPPPPPPKPPPTPQPTITSVVFSPTTLQQGNLLKVTVTVKNNTDTPLSTQGPDPGFTYNEGDNYLTKNAAPVSGALRIGVDYEGRGSIERLDHPYRWGLGTTLAPGKSVTVTGLVRLNRKQNVKYWVALIQELKAIWQDQVGMTQITVVKP